MTAKFITFEGGEGSGKSTQSRLLAERLRATGLAVLETREPGGSPFAERLRLLLLNETTEARSALAETLLFYSARADHLDAMIRPALALGRWVICDRFTDSTRVYQGVGGAVPERVFAALDQAIVAPTLPDLTIICDVPADVGLARAAERRSEAAAQRGSAAVDRFEQRDLGYHERLRAGFLSLAAGDPKRCVVVDATQPREAVAGAIWTAVTQRLLTAR